MGSVGVDGECSYSHSVIQTTEQLQKMCFYFLFLCHLTLPYHSWAAFPQADLKFPVVLYAPFFKNARIARISKRLR